MTRGLAALVSIHVLAAGALHGAAAVGSPAPALEPSEWLNVKGTTSWKDLKGRVLLVEKWRTT